MFYTAQGIIRARSHRYTNEELIERLRTLYQKRGFLSGLVIDENEPVKSWEYAVLVCNTHYELENIGQLYRDRADYENGFDEIKNQLGWGGYSTHDIERCALSARAVALFYNRWS